MICDFLCKFLQTDDPYLDLQMSIVHLYTVPRRCYVVIDAGISVLDVVNFIFCYYSLEHF